MKNTIIDFNILENASAMQTWHYACHEIAKRYQANETIFIYTDNQDDAKRLDDLLWTFTEDSFIPHNILTTTNTASSPIQIGYAENICDNPYFVTAINLSQETLKNFSNYKNLVEIVFPEPAKQQLARVRYKQYRDQGYSIQTNKMKPT